MRREGKPEGVSHQQIMAQLVELKRESAKGRAEIHHRLDKSNERFARLEKAVKPMSDLIEAVGGEEQFTELAVDAARGLAAMAWVGSKLAKLAKWTTVMVAGALALGAAVKFFMFDFWRPVQ